MNQEIAKTRVLFLITKATYGGAQKYVYDLATNLPDDRFEPIVAYGVEGQLASDLRTAHIKTYHILPLDRDISFFSDIRSFFLIRKSIREIRPDVVHLNSSKAGAIGALAARIAGVQRIIFTVHGWPFGEARGLFAKLLIWKISWLTALLSHKVICVSDYDLRTARRMPFIGQKAVRIYNGIDLHMKFGTGDVIRNTFPLGVKITGTIGELNRNKNQMALIEEARKSPDMRVAIVGEGEERSRLEAKIREYNLGERVKLFGFLPTAEVLRGFDVFALPSLKEGLPYVVIEAKLAGLRIVANSVGGVEEILDNDVQEFSLARMVTETIHVYETSRNSASPRV